MADSSMSTFPFPSHLHISSSVTIKLSESNYLLWKIQLESLLRSQKLLGFVTGHIKAPPATLSVTAEDTTSEEPNPEFDNWICTDELIKSWIFGTLTDEVLGYVHGLTTSHEIWISLENNFNKSSIAREFELRRRLQLLTIRGKDFNTYCREFRALCDQLSSIGKPVDESMKIFTFTNGLGREYDPICTVIQSSMARTHPPPTLSDIISEISSFDARLQTYDRPSALHTSDSSGKEWYPDSGASAHITASTQSLQTATPYHGSETVMVGNGEFLPISHVGSSTLTTPAGSIPLSNILVCPNIQKSLLSVSKLCEDYPCGVYFDANEVSIIDIPTQRVVTKGPRREGLYVLENPKFLSLFSNRQVAASDTT